MNKQIIFEANHGRKHDTNLLQNYEQDNEVDYIDSMSIQHCFKPDFKVYITKARPTP